MSRIEDREAKREERADIAFTKKPIDEIIWGSAKVMKIKETIEDLNKKIHEEEISGDQAEIAKHKAQLEQAIMELKDLEKEFTQPHKSKIYPGITEWRNPRWNYYPCYVNNGIKTDKLIHRDLAEKQIYDNNVEFFKDKYPEDSFSKLKIHHVDHDYDNYLPKNLVIISQEEHDKIPHTSIPKGDYKIGLKILKELGIRQPHIIELS